MKGPALVLAVLALMLITAQCVPDYECLDDGDCKEEQE